MDTAYCETKNDDPAMDQRWFDKHALKKDTEGGFELGKNDFDGATPVEVDKLLQNITDNLSDFDYDELAREPFDPRTFVMCAGGPSLGDHLDEIRAKSLDPDNYLVVCSNMTGGYLLENGIVPHVHFLIDPKPRKALDFCAGKTRPNIEYWINCSCDPSVVRTLNEQGIRPRMFLAQWDKDGKDLESAAKALDPAKQHNMMGVQGGTMAGLRAMNLADARGFRKIEYYGFDASVIVEGDKAKPYAYEKRRGEAIIDVKCDRCDAHFDTTLVLQKQVNEFLEWRNRMPWLDIKIHGNGLMPHYVQHLVDEESGAVSKQRFTQEYAALQLEMHADTEHEYGVAGAALCQTVFSLICQMTKRNGYTSVLDYGAAKGTTEVAIRDQFWLPPGVTFHNYEPFVDGFDTEPEPADCVLCIDVMEHVEPGCTKAVLDHIQALTQRVALFSICMEPAKKKLSDGRNAHINLRDKEFWLTQLNKRFILNEVRVRGANLLAVGRSIASAETEWRKARGN